MGEQDTDIEATGMERRYHVEKINDPTGKHDDCRYFVLDPQHDEHAVTALRAYAAEVGGPLAEDIAAWLRRLDFCPGCSQMRGHRGRCRRTPAVEPFYALADRWQGVLDECKASDPRWILDRSVTTLDTALRELRAALGGRTTPEGDAR